MIDPADQRAVCQAAVAALPRPTLRPTAAGSVRKARLADGTVRANGCLSHGAIRLPCETRQVTNLTSRDRFVSALLAQPRQWVRARAA
jgi:hypothetical protein